MRSLRFASNMAVSKAVLTTVIQKPAVERWKLLRDEAEFRELEWLHNLECGRGGALYFDLRSVRNASCLEVHIKDTTISNNSAYMGGNACQPIPVFRRSWSLGGVYISRRWVLRKARNAGRALPVMDIGANECRGVRYFNATVTGNSAKVAGGGMFVTDIADLSAYNVSGSILGVERNRGKEYEDVLSLVGNIVQVSSVH